MTEGTAPVAESAPERSSPLRRALQGLVSLTVVVAIFAFVLPQFASYSDVWEAIRDMTWLEVTTLLAVTAWNLITYWFVLMSVLPGLSFPQAAVVNQTSTAVANSVPGGGAIAVGVTFAMERSWGFTNSAITLAVLVSGVFNNFAKLGFPVVALALLALEGGANPALVVAAAAGVAMLIAVIAVFALILRSRQLAVTIGNGLGRVASRLLRLVRRPPVTAGGEAAARFRDQTIGLLGKRWTWTTLATLVSHASLFVVLLVALRHVGVSQEEVTWIEALAAFSFIRLVAALPITPGGLGVVELGLVAALQSGLDDVTKAQVVAAVLVFRFLTFVLPVPLGAGTYLFWRRNRSWRRPVPDPA